MASTYSTLARLELMANGENDNTWGSKTNTNLLLIERMVAKRTAVVLASSDYTLTTQNGADDESRALALDLSGTLTANVNVIIPNLSKQYLVRNNTTGAFTVTVKTAAGTGVVVTQGRLSLVWCDGVSSGTVFNLLTGFPTAADRNAWTAGNSDTIVNVTDAATGIVNAALGNVFYWVLAGTPRTAQLDNPVSGSWVELYLKQDATGSRTVTWPGNVLWENGSAPSLTPNPNAIDKVFLRYHVPTATWWGTYNLNISSGASPGTIPDVTIEGGHVNIDAYAMAGMPSTAVSFTFTIAAGANIGSMSTASPALDFSGFPAGSTISIVNNGTIHGRGGRGGRGAFAGDVASANLYGDGTAGGAGGDAIRLPSAACTINITNINGRILGGGGGGGGGPVTHDGDGSNVGVGGGGGGGGAGGGESGDGGSVVSANGAPGSPGSIGRAGTFGAGGAGADTGGTGTAGNGGNGGAYGAAGATPAALTTNTFDGAPGAGGAAGKAVNVNGGTAPTFISGASSPNVEGAVS